MARRLPTGLTRKLADFVAWERVSRVATAGTATASRVSRKRPRMSTQALAPPVGESPEPRRWIM